MFPCPAADYLPFRLPSGIHPDLRSSDVHELLPRTMFRRVSRYYSLLAVGFSAMVPLQFLPRQEARLDPSSEQWTDDPGPQCPTDPEIGATIVLLVLGFAVEAVVSLLPGFCPSRKM